MSSELIAELYYPAYACLDDLLFVFRHEGKGLYVLDNGLWSVNVKWGDDGFTVTRCDVHPEHLGHAVSESTLTDWCDYNRGSIRWYRPGNTRAVTERVFPQSAPRDPRRRIPKKTLISVYTRVEAAPIVPAPKHVKNPKPSTPTAYKPSISQNYNTLAACPSHSFSKEAKGSRVYVCANCGGTTDCHAIRWYLQGRAHGATIKETPTPRITP